MSRLYGLDALRGVAALAVALHHLAYFYGWTVPISPALAVDLFFILSGFVMTRTYEQRLNAGLGVSAFVRLRYRRLFWPMAVGSTLGLLAIGFSVENFAAWVLILGFMPAVWMAHCFIINVPAWSLFYEIMSNALHARFFAKIPTLALGGLWFGLAAATAPFILSRFVHWNADAAGLLVLLPRCLASYLAGVILFRVYGDKPLGNTPWLAVCAAAGALCAGSLGGWAELAVLFIFAPLIVRASLALPKSRLAAMAGALSFPLYAVHVPVIGIAKSAGLPAGIALAVALVAAAIVMFLFEPSHRPADDPSMRRDRASGRGDGRTKANVVSVPH